MHRFLIFKTQLLDTSAGRCVLSHQGRAQIIIEWLTGRALIGEEEPGLLGTCYMLAPCVRRFGHDVALISGRELDPAHRARMLADIFGKEVPTMDLEKNQIDGESVEADLFGNCAADRPQGDEEAEE